MPSGLASPRSLDELVISSASGARDQQSGEQRIFLRARQIDVIDFAGHEMFAVKIGAQGGAAEVGGRFDRRDALGGNPGPVGNRWLRDSDAAREFAYAAAARIAASSPLSRIASKRPPQENVCRHSF